MKQIRLNVFETNSSSSHSLTINNKTHINKNELKIKNIYTYIDLCENYGWEEKSYSLWTDKLNYCLVSLWNYMPQDVIENTQGIVSDFFKAVDVIFSHQDFLDYIEYDEDRDLDYYINRFDGGIDHQSNELIIDEYGKYQDGVQFFNDLIFGVNSVIETDNDNHY